ncbi:hypothetical protein K9L67_02540 [Candidatus Woesearchaeota archaeon]|nr:hypothetical protein [Candidatus Woesearchaeota archaeon]MCF7901083.1 hypothetical protein [Candidatus Woesearchaeota archaeon]MCF8013134.1 hypothetical protein [Candidatus Woesearchaeota archaeon]
MSTLIEILEREHPKHRELLTQLKKTAHTIYERISAYIYRHINIVSHLADADGLASLLLDEGLKPIAQLAGKTQIQKGEKPQPYHINIQSERHMTISNDEEHENSITKIKERMSDGTYIFSDLSVMTPKKLEQLEEAIILDHHKPLDFKGKHQYINPCNYGIDGAKELSGSLLSGLLLHYIKDELVTDVKLDKKIEKELNQKIDYLTMLAIAGSKADQQKDEGINKTIYEYYTHNQKLQKEDSPFFGYFTKTIPFAIAESQIPLNLKYDVASNDQRETFLTSQGYTNNINVTRKIRQETDLLFATNIQKKQTGINKIILDTLSEKKIEKINEEFKKEYGKNLISTTKSGERYVTNSKGDFIDPIIEDYKDDEKRHTQRIILTDRLLYDLKIEKTHMNDVRGIERKKLMKNLKKKILAFSDPRKKEENLEMFLEEQYIINNDTSKLLKYKSIAELANDMTAFSKMGEGDLFMQAVSIELEGNYDPNDEEQQEIFRKLKTIKAKYNITIHDGMELIEDWIMNNDPKSLTESSLSNIYSQPENKSKLIEFGKGAYLLQLDDLEKELEQSKEFLRVMTGVFGGITAKSRLLPGEYGVLFTSLETEEGLYKISARTNKFPGQKVQLGDFYEQMTKLEITESGGGHPDAASCYVKKENLDQLGEYIKEQYVMEKTT